MTKLMSTHLKEVKNVSSVKEMMVSNSFCIQNGRFNFRWHAAEDDARESCRRKAAKLKLNLMAAMPSLLLQQSLTDRCTFNLAALSYFPFSRGSARGRPCTAIHILTDKAQFECIRSSRYLSTARSRFLFVGCF